MGVTTHTERIGIGTVLAKTHEFGWIFREQPRPDEGVDAQIESTDDSGLGNNRLIAAQVKSGPSWFKNATDGGWHFYASRKKVAYWLGGSLPVIIILYNHDSDTAYWQVVTRTTARETADGNFAFVIPNDQVYGPTAEEALERLANEGLPTQPDELEKELDQRRAQADISWLELLADGARLFLEIEEWVNKTSGRVALRLVVEDDRGRQVTTGEWPWAFIPGAPLAEELPGVFPWASLSVDESRYREEEHVQYVAEHGIWDKEDGTYYYAEDFDDWYADRHEQGLRPYGEAGGGEVALWRLELTLNDLGRRTVDRARSKEYFDVLLRMDAEDAAEQARRDGYYEGQYGEIHGNPFEAILFVTDADANPVLGDTELWSSEDGRRRTAAAILGHALQREPTSALTGAFVGRFRGDMDDEGQGWVITYREIQGWLHELGV